MKNQLKKLEELFDKSCDQLFQVDDPIVLIQGLCELSDIYEKLDSFNQTTFILHNINSDTSEFLEKMKQFKIIHPEPFVAEV